MKDIDPYWDTFCVYCQRHYKTVGRLKRHLIIKHSGTYAAHSIAGEP